MIYNIISTGSKGNAVILNENILIDCGVPYYLLQEHIGKLKYVLLTHIHGDHFNVSTIKRLSSERPTLRFTACEWLLLPLLEAGVSKRNIDILKLDRVYGYENLRICPVTLLHNVPNCGYKLSIGREKVFYATDTNELKHILAKNYDLYLIEANYGEQEIIDRIKLKLDSGEYSYEEQVVYNHLSKEKAEKWLSNNAGENSEFEFIHRHI